MEFGISLMKFSISSDSPGVIKYDLSDFHESVIRRKLKISGNGMDFISVISASESITANLIPKLEKTGWTK